MALDVADEDIDWEEKTGVVNLKLDGTALKLAVGSKTLLVNDKPKQMDVAPLIREGRTYLPARWVAEAFGYKVNWDESTRAVLIGPPGTCLRS